MMFELMHGLGLADCFGCEVTFLHSASFASGW